MRKQPVGRSQFGLRGIWEEEARLPKLSNFGFLRHFVSQALRSMASAPVHTALTILTTTVALSIFSIFILFVENLRSGLLKTNASQTLTIVMREQAGDSEIEALSKTLRARGDVIDLKVTSKSEALSELRAALGEQSDVLEGLDTENPLPRSIQITPRAETDGDFDSFAEVLRHNPLVERVLYDRGALGELSVLIKLIEWGGAIGLGVLLVMSAFVIASTIRLALYAHRDEINIMRLVGAHRRFIAAPFLIEGTLEGLCGGVLSLMLVYGLYCASWRAVEHSSLLQLVVPTLSFLSPIANAVVVGVGTMVGFFGSLATLRRLSGEYSR